MDPATFPGMAVVRCKLGSDEGEEIEPTDVLLSIMVRIETVLVHEPATR